MLATTKETAASYENNLKRLGYVEFDEPITVSICPKDFESKEEVVRLLNTYNERMENAGKKEIGILRAIGASKNNISQVFNAETFIIGLCAGIIGIGLTLLMLIPGNALIHRLAGTDEINAVLPVIPAVILVLLSVILTLLGGLLLSRKAAKSDPVTALRTE